MEEKRRQLMVLCGALWLVAGFNVVRMGVLALFVSLWRPVFTTIGIAVVFLAFGAMFTSISLKNVKRIDLLEPQKLKFWNCMPLKSWLIMIFMISFGVWLRGNEAVSRGFIASFYIGLGSALSLAGLLYFVKLLRR